MTRFPVFAFSVATVLLAGCTLTPSRFDGYDLLDTGHKTENQDPVAVPVKEPSDRAWVKTSAKKVEPPVFEKPANIKPQERTVVKTEAVKPVEAPVVKKEEPKTEAVKSEAAKSALKSDPCPAKGDVPPPPRPDALLEKLKSGERLKITVFREKDLTGDYQVNDKGIITFPLIGQVQAAGITPSQLQAHLVQELSKGYLVKPEVSVERLSDCNKK